MKENASNMMILQLCTVIKEVYCSEYWKDHDQIIMQRG
jgi:hypothetical protein